MNAKSKNLDQSWVDPDDAPEITKEWIETTEIREGDRIIRRGRPMGSAKTPTSVRLDNEVLEAFRATGPRWQSRLNAALADWLETHSPAELAV